MGAVPPSQGQLSPDGRWWWDGSKWAPVAPRPPAPALPGAQIPITYQQPSPYPGPVYVRGPRSNSYAVASLVLGILSWFICPIIGAVIAVILGHAARGQIRQTGEGGNGMAIAGLILGYAHLAVWGVFIIFWLLLFGGFAALMGVIGTLPVASPSP
jgi:Domain of unknown function (DUF4190)